MDLAMIACLAIVGKKNDALFLETFVPEKDHQLRFHYLVHSALDIYEERRVTRKGSSGGSSGVDMYMGHLCPIEEFRLYGYLTSTQAKIIAVLTEGEPVRDADLRAVLVGVHQLYVNYVQCPFAPLSGKINSDRFRHGVGRQVNLYNGVN